MHVDQYKTIKQALNLTYMVPIAQMVSKWETHTIMLSKNSATKLALALVSASVITVPLQLQADGAIGNTSTDSISVTILKDDSVRISAMEDVDFGSNASLAVDTTLPEAFCVFASNGGYQITGTTSNNNTSNFQMVSGSNTLNYQLALTTVGATAAPLTPGVALAGLTGNIVADDCLGVPNTTITVTVLADDFNAASPGAYADTLTMLVEPE